MQNNTKLRMQKIVEQIVLILKLDTQVQFSCLHILGKYRHEKLFNDYPSSVIAALVYLLQKLHNTAQDRIGLVQYCSKIASVVSVKQHQIAEIQQKITKLTKWKLAEPTIWNYFLIFALEWDKFTQTNSVAKIKFVDPLCPTLLELSNNYCLNLIRNLNIFQYISSDQFGGNNILQQRWKQLALVFLWIMIVIQSREICQQSKFLPYRSTLYIFKDFLSQLRRNNIFTGECLFEKRTQKLLLFQYLPMMLSSSLQICFAERRKYKKCESYFNHQKTNKKPSKSMKNTLLLIR